MPPPKFFQSRPYVWTDATCPALPEFDTRRFCKQALRCESLLLVGDSTQNLVYEALEAVLAPKPTKRFFGRRPSRRETCTDKRGDVRKLTEICTKDCHARPVYLTYMRHDHLMGFGAEQCNWASGHVMKQFAFLLLTTGVHINDDPALAWNVGDIWATKTNRLIEYLNTNHPCGIIWRTAWYGADPFDGKCPLKEVVRQAPLKRSEIAANRFNGSWVQISRFNEFVKAKLRDAWPNLPILDVENMFSMRPDCRRDWIHFASDKAASPIFALPSLVQHLLERTPFRHIDGGQCAMDAPEGVS